MGVKYKDPLTGNFVDLSVKVADTLPIGTEVDYDGNTPPPGWEEIDSAAVNDIITSGANSKLTISTTGGNKIPITKYQYKIGTGFTISNNKIYVGAGINHVLVSASVYCNLASSRETSILNFIIYRNNIEECGLVNNGYTNGINKTLSISPKLVSVSQGDYFEFGVYASAGDEIRSETGFTYLTIQKID